MIQQRVAVCVIAYNEKNNIVRLLQQIIDENLKSVHIFVDSSGSTDGTSNLVSEFESKHPEVLTHIRGDKRRGKHIAYNELLLQMKSYKYSFFLDADVQLTKRAIHKLIRYLINNPQYKIVGSFLVPELVKGSHIPQIYRKVKEHIYSIGENWYFTGRSFGARTKYLPLIPEKSCTDDFFLNLQFKTEEIGICKQSVVMYVMPYSTMGMFLHSFHIGNTISDLRDNFKDLWKEQIKRVPLVNYVVFGLTQNKFGNFWSELSSIEKITFVYSRIVTMAGFLIGFYTKNKRMIWEPIEETKELLDEAVGN